MLVLARHEGESIRIADEIELKVIEINRGQVRIGIEASRDIPIAKSIKPGTGKLAARIRKRRRQ